MPRRQPTADPAERERARLFYDGDLVMEFDTFAEARAAVLALPATEWPHYTIRHDRLPQPTAIPGSYNRLP
jgi:hypothetical protein